MEIDMEDVLPQIYQTVLINFGNTIYSGDSLEEAKAAAINAGFESVVTFDGAIVCWYSPIGGWRK